MNTPSPPNPINATASGFHQPHTVITGGGSGVGAIIAKKIAASMTPVTLIGRRISPLKTTTREVRQNGGICKAVSADMSDEI